MNQDNNGWIKIENKEDLPPAGYYWTVSVNGVIRAMVRDNGRIVNDNEYWLNNLAYYQLFSPRKPEPPIY